MKYKNVFAVEILHKENLFHTEKFASKYPTCTTNSNANTTKMQKNKKYSLWNTITTQGNSADTVPVNNKIIKHNFKHFIQLAKAPT